MLNRTALNLFRQKAGPPCREGHDITLCVWGVHIRSGLAYSSSSCSPLPSANRLRSERRPPSGHGTPSRLLVSVLTAVFVVWYHTPPEHVRYTVLETSGACILTMLSTYNVGVPFMDERPVPPRGMGG